jgi:hypothetical protein
MPDNNLNFHVTYSMLQENKIIRFSCYSEQIEKYAKRNYTLKSSILFSVIMAKGEKFVYLAIKS